MVEVKLVIAAFLWVGASALVPAVPRAVSSPRTVAFQSVVEKGTTVLDDTDGLGAEFDDALVDEAWDEDDSGEDMLAGFDLDGADVGEIREWAVPPRSICEDERAAHVEKYARHGTDSGSSEVQIALFTARIKHITQHVIDNPKDHASRRGLLALVSKRRRIMHYYNSKSPEKAQALADELGIRFRFKSKLPDRTEKYRQYTIAANKKRK